MKLIRELLKEFDSSDLALIKRHDDKRKGAAGSKKFSKSMEKSQTPSAGDIIVKGKMKFTVKGGSLKGLEVVELGAERRKMTIPHGTRFGKPETNNFGKKVFTLKMD